MGRRPRRLLPAAAFILVVCPSFTVPRAQQPASVSAAGPFSELHWRMIGPFRGGRTKAATGVPSQPNVFYIGAVNGGVWKSTDYGVTWKPIFDDQPTGSIGAIAVAPSNPDVIYVGSGEGLQRPDLSTGDGIYKSTDAGRTWTHLGLQNGQQIPQIIVDPTNPDRLFVAVLGHPYGPNEERGIFRSTDGGHTFQKVLYKDENTGGVDLAFDPSNANHVYAVLWEARQGPWENGAFGGPGSGLFESTDGGTSWKPLTKGLPNFEQGGLGRIGIGIAPSEPRRMYATVQATNGGGLYRSDDGGQSWSRPTENTLIVTRGDDFAEVKVDPKSPDIVYTASVVSWKSIDGGKTFRALRGAPGGDDYHRIWINPTNTDIILIASDQGAVITVNGGESWSSWYNQPTAQFYHVSTDNAFPYRVCGGQQESGSACVQSRSDDGRITFREWHPVGVEEYGYVAPDPLNPDIVYGGKVSRYNRKTGEVVQVPPAPNRGGQSGDYRTIRTMPVLFSPIDPHTLYFASNTLWKTTTGGNVWTRISPDLTRKTWDVPANVGKYRNTPAARVAERGVIYTIAPSYSDINRIWVGSDDGLIHVTADGGKTWKDVTPRDLKPWAKVSMMDASHTNPLGAYAAINTFRLDDLRPHLYRTQDGGKTWKQIVTGLPAGATVNTVKEDAKRKGLLFAGTETQVYVSFDDGDNWQSLRVNMPATSIRDLVIKDDDLVVGTHGRGFWILDDITPLRQWPLDTSARASEVGVGAPRSDRAGRGAEDSDTSARGSGVGVGAPRSDRAGRGAGGPAISNDVVLLKPQVATRVEWNRNPDTPLPPDEPAGENPPDGALIHYFLREAAGGPVTIEILESGGNTVRRYSSEDQPVEIRDEGNVPSYWIRPSPMVSTNAGLHRFVWDLHFTPLPGPRSYPIAATPHNTAPEPKGPWVPAGTYTVKLTVGGKAYTQPLVVRMDPRIKVAPVALQQQFMLSKRLYDAIVKIHDVLPKVGEARDRAQAAGKTDVAQKLSSLAGPAGGGRGRGRGAGLSTEPGLTTIASELATLYSLSQDGSGLPPTQTVAAAEDALKRYNGIMTRVMPLLR